MTPNDLQVILPPAVVPVTQIGCRTGIRWGSRLQWPLSLSTTYSRAGYASWALEGCLSGVKTTNSLQVFLPTTVVPVT